MSLTEEERRIIVGLEMEKARKIFDQTDKLAKLGYWDNVINRLYYALFHAMSALLISDKHNINTHKDIVASMGQYYIKTGKLTEEDGRLYSQLQTMREKSDYNCSYEAAENEVNPKIILAKKLMDDIFSITDNNLKCK